MVITNHKLGTDVNKMVIKCLYNCKGSYYSWIKTDNAIVYDYNSFIHFDSNSFKAFRTKVYKEE